MLYLPQELVAEILTNAIETNQISLRETCKAFRDALPLMAYRKVNLRIKLKNIQSKKPFTWMGDRFDHYGRIAWHATLPKCINITCRNGSKWQLTSKQLGQIFFYYPEELYEPHDEYDDPYGINFEAGIRQNQCKNGPSVKRCVPYCRNCMKEYMNFGEREDGLDVPFGEANGNAYNL